MNQAPLDFQDRIECYLDGLLDEAETSRFEQDLLTLEVAEQFREGLLFRELLAALPPDQPPSALVQRIESAMDLAGHKRKKQGRTETKEVSGSFLKALKAGFRWPAYAVAGVANGSGGLRGSVLGMQTIGYSLGPLLEPARKGMQRKHRPRKPLWKTALSGLWRGVSS